MKIVLQTTLSIISNSVQKCFFPKDYVTEKFFKILPYNVIPVVFNGANMSAIAPPHSYINAEDFSSVEQLAEYLQLVASNDSLFASYFWWRDYYKALTVGGGEDWT